jgi:4-amino-4-deoxy-L-arabinose transferase
VRRAAIGLGLLWLLVYVAPLGVLPMGSPDEARYAEIAREMLVSGDHVVPRLNGLLYLEKPPLVYWTTELSLAVFGLNSFAVRLQSALSVALTALLVGLLVRRFTGSSEESLLSAAVYGTGAMVFGLGSVAIPDNLLTLFLTGTLAAGLCALDATRRGARAGWLAAAGLSCGLAFLTKGFLAVAVPGMVIAAWLVFSSRRWGVIKLIWLPALTAVATVLPWGILIHRSQPQFWSEFIWVQHIERFLAPAGATHHPEPLWYFLPVLSYGTMPWLLMIPAATAGLLLRRRREPWLLGIVAWFVLPLLFFSASSGKLATYILPIFPPLAIIMAAGLMEYARHGRGRRLFNVGAAISGVAALLTMPGVWIFARPYYGPGEMWKWLMIMVALAAWAVCSLLAMRGQTLRRGIRAYAAAPLVLFFACHFLYPTTAEARPSLGAFIEQNRSEIPPSAMVVADTESVHGVCWLLQRNDLFLFPVGGELSYGLGREEQQGRLLAPEKLVEWVIHPGRREDLVIIIDEEKFGELLDEHLAPLPIKPIFSDQDLGFRLLRFAPVEGQAGPVAGGTNESPS